MKFAELAEPTGEVINGFHVLRIKQGKFKDVEFNYGETSFGDTEEEFATLKFEYEIHAGKELVEANLEDFRQFSGDMLVSIIEEQLMNNEVVYSGGTD